jgi:UDP-glucose 4-epimerase
MKILVTGGAGFIGGHLVETLVQQGHNVIVVDNESATSSDKFNWFDAAENYKINILDDEKMEVIFSKGLDYVFHLAAETKIQLAVEQPEKCFDSNITGTVKLLELSKKHKVKRVIVASSSSVYGMNPIPNHELQIPDCLNPYAASKLCDEIICSTYSKIYNLETISFRFFNVFGERMPNRGAYAPVIAIFDRQKLNNESMTITGDGNQRRDFVYVKDVVDALICGMTTTNINCIGQAYNVGNGTNISINEIAKFMKGEYVYIPERKGDAKETLADLNKIKKDLTWTPKVNVLDWLNKFCENRYDNR